MFITAKIALIITFLFEVHMYDFLTIHSNNWRHLPIRVKIYGSSLLNATASLFEEILFVRDRLRFIIERNWKRNTYSSLVRMKFFITPSRGFEMYRFRYITSTCVSIVMVTCRFVLKNVPGIHCSRRFDRWCEPAILSPHSLLFISRFETLKFTPFVT